MLGSCTADTRPNATVGRSQVDGFQLRQLMTAEPWNHIEPTEYLYDHGHNLPTDAQNRPEQDLATQPDFYYIRDGVKGACVFVDGAQHNQPGRQAADNTIRQALAGRGYRVIAITGSQPFGIQLEAHPDIFGRPS